MSAFPRKSGPELVDDIKRFRNAFGCGLREANDLVRNKGSYEAAAAHMAEGGIVESDAAKISRLEAEVARLSNVISDERRRVEKMRRALLVLDGLGGLGHMKHEVIKEALGVPYPRFCRHAEKCLTAGRCAAESVCND